MTNDSELARLDGCWKVTLATDLPPALVGVVKQSGTHHKSNIFPISWGIGCHWRGRSTIQQWFKPVYSPWHSFQPPSGSPNMSLRKAYQPIRANGSYLRRWLTTFWASLLPVWVSRGLNFPSRPKSTRPIDRWQVQNNNGFGWSKLHFPVCVFSFHFADHAPWNSGWHCWD